MVKIIGSSKIDDYRKVVLEEGVMKSLNVKPGDSLLFYKKDHDSSLCLFKAEGAHVTGECDSPMQNHLQEEPRKIRTYVFATIAMFVFMLFAVLMNLSSLDSQALILFVVFWVVGFFALVLVIKKLDRIDAPYETQSLVTVGGPYTKNRITGLSKLNDDGYAVSGELYINSLFGANPKNVEVVMNYQSGSSELILTKCTKTVPGYSTYKMRFRDEGLEKGTLVVTTTFGYIGKTITVTSTFDVDVAPGRNSKAITITEGSVGATMAFDDSLNDSGFDEALFDPTDDEEVF